MRAVLSVIFLTGLAMATSAAQTPRPFPQPGTAQPQTPPSSQAPAPVRPAAPPATQPAAPPPVTPPPAASAQPAGAPPAETVVYPVHPTAQFIASYDAGRGQRYYLYGSTAPYTELVAFYRTQLKEKGDEVFDQPPTYMFQIGRFRDETMAFPPGVTVKDWTWGGSQGYPNPKLGAQPARFPSVIMIVPPPPVPPAAR